MTFPKYNLDLDLSSREAANESRKKVRQMDREGAFDLDPNMPDAAFRVINRDYPPIPDIPITF